MIDCKNEYFNLDQIDNMRHAVGFEPEETRKGQRVYRCQRNYFSCSRPDPAWEDLCKHGFAMVLCRAVRDGRIVYKVSADGLKALSYIYRIEFEEVLA